MNIKLMTALVVSLLVSAAWAQNNPGGAEKRELIYCADLMTHEEREAYRATMQAARTVDEKAKLRADHQVAMQARAVSQGVAGSCEPAQRRGPVAGQGPGGARR